MEQAYPVYTIDAECQDCYKCVRRCPVKAIRVKDGHASIVPELCICCGKCVEICPAKAKQVRSDLGKVEELLADGKKKVYLSLAPSYVSEFKGVSPERFAAAARRLGFAGISETALGAQVVSAACAEWLETHDKGVFISSACPAAVEYIRKYLPRFAPCVTPFLSPVLSHCKLLKETYGPEIEVVFVGPCFAKKMESDRHPELLRAALTFREFRDLLRRQKLVLEELTVEAADRFVPRAAEEGARYPIDGGMNDTIRAVCRKKAVYYAALTGFDSLELALGNLEPGQVEELIFLEVLACGGGCVHGPGTEHDSPGLLERLRVLDQSKIPLAIPERRIASSIREEVEKTPLPEVPEYSDRELSGALHRIGKFTLADELNCGGCGYENCRTFARAMLQGKAEPSMCVSYMRKLAQKKANALLRCIPAGVVIVDDKLEIVECNRKFAELSGEDVVMAFDASPGLNGADARRVIAFVSLFETVLQTGSELQRDFLKVGEKLFNVTLFNIEPHEVVGGVIFDVTGVEMRRELIAARARKVIDTNLAAVQEIACRLGEQMAETELLLRSIADNYAEAPGPEKPSEDKNL